MNDYKLYKDGDILEQKYWDKFIKKDFPSYERYWQEYIVNLTNRPFNVRFKNIEELKKINKCEHDVYLAQLHYTVLKHLVRVFNILEPSKIFQYDKFFEGISRICSALDVADEFLERIHDPKKYTPWNIYSGEAARKNWIRTNKNENMQTIRYYRNYLMHCPLLPSFHGILYPKIEHLHKYYKWVSLSNSKEDYKNDFDTTFNILKDTWLKVLQYLEHNWNEFLKHSNLTNLSNSFVNTDTKDFLNGTGEIKYFKSYYAKGASDIFTEEEYKLKDNIIYVENKEITHKKSNKKHLKKRKKKK